MDMIGMNLQMRWLFPGVEEGSIAAGLQSSIGNVGAGSAYSQAQSETVGKWYDLAPLHHVFLTLLLSRVVFHVRCVPCRSRIQNGGGRRGKCFIIFRWWFQSRGINTIGKFPYRTGWFNTPIEGMGDGKKEGGRVWELRGLWLWNFPWVSAVSKKSRIGWLQPSCPPSNTFLLPFPCRLRVGKTSRRLRQSQLRSGYSQLWKKKCLSVSVDFLDSVWSISGSVWLAMIVADFFSRFRTGSSGHGWRSA